MHNARIDGGHTAGLTERIVVTGLVMPDGSVHGVEGRRYTLDGEPTRFWWAIEHPDQQTLDALRASSDTADAE